MPAQPIRIASYNIRKSVGLDWIRDPGRIMQVIDELDADIVAVQEVDKRFGKREGTLPVEEGILANGYRIATNDFSDHSQGWHGNAILYRDTVKLVECNQIGIPTLEPRGAVTALFVCPNGSRVRVIGTHLSLAGYMRRRQMLKLMQYVNHLEGKTPTVIAGDFNEWRANGKAVRDLARNFEVVTPGASFHASLPYLSLDRFVLSNNISLVNAGVHESRLAKTASDHLPIHVTVALNDAAEKRVGKAV